MLQEYICLKLCSFLEFRYVIAEKMLLCFRYEYVRYGFVICIETVIIVSHKTTSMERSTRSTQEHLEKIKPYLRCEDKQMKTRYHLNAQYYYICRYIYKQNKNTEKGVFRFVKCTNQLY